MKQEKQNPKKVKSSSSLQSDSIRMGDDFLSAPPPPPALGWTLFACIWWGRIAIGLASSLPEQSPAMVLLPCYCVFSMENITEFIGTIACFPLVSSFGVCWLVNT